MSDFIKLTLPDGSEGRLSPEDVIRIRRTIVSESEHGARTRIDWVGMMLVKEAPEAVASLVDARLSAQRRSLGKLRLPDGTPVWFNAGLARGPLPLPGGLLTGGAHSGMELAGERQLLANTPQEVHDELAAKDGDALPVPAVPLAS